MRVIFRTTIIFIIITVILSYSLLIAYGFEIQDNQQEQFGQQMSQLINRKEELANTYLMLENEKLRLQQELLLISAVNQTSTADPGTVSSNTQTTNVQPTPLVQTQPVVKTVQKVVTQPVVRRVTTRAS
jgi:hypothetical protein